MFNIHQILKKTTLIMIFARFKQPKISTYYSYRGRCTFFFFYAGGVPQGCVLGLLLFFIQLGQ